MALKYLKFIINISKYLYNVFTIIVNNYVIYKKKDIELSTYRTVGFLNHILAKWLEKRFKRLFLSICGQTTYASSHIAVGNLFILVHYI